MGKPTYRALFAPIHVSRAQAELNRISDEPDVFLVYPHLLHCHGCGTSWIADAPLNTDLSGVTCSNCYGEDVFLRTVKIQRLELEGHDARVS